MTTTDAAGNEIILEPGDPGYVDPNAPPPEPAPTEGEAVHAPPGEDLTHQQQPGESDAAFRARTTGVVVDSQSPADIVPNTPQTTMGARVMVPESEPPVYVGVPPEQMPPPEEPPPPEGEQTSSPQEGEATA